MKRPIVTIVVTMLLATPAWADEKEEPHAPRPLTAAEARYHRRTVELQTTASPALFRMMYLAQRSIDATWQRDIRVHRSTILDDEYPNEISHFSSSRK